MRSFGWSNARRLFFLFFLSHAMPMPTLILSSSVTQSSRMRRRRRASRRKWRQRRASERASGLQKSVVTRSRAAGRKAGAGRGRGRPKLSEGRHSLAHSAAHTHTAELFGKSLQIPDVWISLGGVGGGEEIDLSRCLIQSSSPRFFRTS